MSKKFDSLILQIRIDDNVEEQEELNPIKTDNNHLDLTTTVIHLHANGNIKKPDSDAVDVTRITLIQNHRRYTGLILAIFAGIFITLSMAIIKMLNNFHPFSLTMWRYLFNTISGLPFIIYFQFWKKSAPFSSIWEESKCWKENSVTIFWMWLSCVCGTVTFILRYFSLRYLSVADSTVIAYSGPIVIVFLAHIFLNEKCGIVSIIIAIWTFLGVVSITRPPFLTGQSEFSGDILLGTGLALVAMVLGSIAIILLRKIRQVQFSITTLCFALWGTFQSAVLGYFWNVIQVPDNLEDALLMTAMSALSFAGGICVTLAVKFEQAGPYALIRSGDILYAFVWQFVFLNVSPDLASILGALIVISGIGITTFRKWISTLPEGNRTRHTYSFLLR